MEDVIEAARPACANCGRPVSGRGQRPSDGVWFCSKRECRAARNRRSYARRAGDPEMESRPCSRCGDELPTRPQRSTDHPLGRWCNRRVCQQAKRQTLSPAGIERSRQIYNAWVEQRERAKVADRHPCDRCGFERGILGFIHPDTRPSAILPFCNEQGDEVPITLPAGYEAAFGPGGPFAK